MHKKSKKKCKKKCKSKTKCGKGSCAYCEAACGKPCAADSCKNKYGTSSKKLKKCKAWAEKGKCYKSSKTMTKCFQTCTGCTP